MSILLPNRFPLIYITYGNAWLSVWISCCSSEFPVEFDLSGAAGTAAWWCSHFGDLQCCRVTAFCRMPAEEEITWKEMLTLMKISNTGRHWQNWESHPSLWAPFFLLSSLRAFRSISYNYYLIILKLSTK